MTESSMRWTEEIHIFIQKQNLREWKKSNHAPSLKHSGILLLNEQNDPRCVKAKEVIPRTACEYHTLMESKLSQCPVLRYLKKNCDSG